MRGRLGILLAVAAVVVAATFGYRFVVEEGEAIDRAVEMPGAGPLAPPPPEEGSDPTLRGRPGAGEVGPGALEEGSPEAPPEVMGSSPGGAALRGRVVRGEGRVPVARARVRLLRPDALFTYLRADPKGRFDELLAVTGKDGRFAFRDVVPADGYVVRVKVSETPHASVGPIDLRVRRSRDLGDIRVGPAGALIGRVVGVDGEPMPDVRVAVTWRVETEIQTILADPETLPSIEEEARTDEDGRFRVEALEPGEKTVAFDAGARGAVVLPAIEVVEGGEADAGDVTLGGPLAIAGRVLWDGGDPVAGARVVFGPATHPSARSFETAADGTWRFEGVTEGMYRMGAFVPGLPVQLKMGVRAGDTEVLFTFPAPGSIEGRVIAEAGRRPVERFTVSPEPEDESDWMQRYLRELIERVLGPAPFSDEKGRFLLPRVAAGTYRLRVTAEGHPVTLSEPVEVVAGERASVTVMMPEGHGAQGTVRSTRGTPVPAARVYVGPDSLAEGEIPAPALEDWADSQGMAAVTDADGAFRIPPQTPGMYAVLALHEDHSPTILRHVDLERAAATGLVIRMPEAGRVEGTLYDDLGSPAAEETVGVLYPDGTLFDMETDEEGHFDRSPLPPGSCLAFWYGAAADPHVLAVENADTEEERERAYEAMRSWTTEIAIVPGRRERVLLRMPLRAVVTGTLSVDGRAAGEQTGVWVTTPGSRKGSFHRCDGQGRFEFRVPPGVYQLWAPDAEMEWQNSPLEVTGTSDQRIDLKR